VFKLEIKKISLSEVRKGTYILIDNEPCKVIDVSMSKTGKHGHTKFRILAVGLFDNRKRDYLTSEHSIDSPIINKSAAQVLSVSGNMANVMDETTYETFDLEIPDEFKESVVAGINIIYWEVGGKRILQQIKG